MLVRRCIAEGTRIPAPAVIFEVPLLLRGRVPRGSDLRVCKNLHKLLTWPRPEGVPDLAVVVLDADGNHRIRPQLASCIGERPLPRPPVCLGVAVQEFEAWLHADQKTVDSVVDQAHGRLPDLESMPPGEAKRILQEWLGIRYPNDPDARSAARKEIAARSDLEEIARRCRSFVDFRRDLLVAVPA